MKTPCLLLIVCGAVMNLGCSGGDGTMPIINGPPDPAEQSASAPAQAGTNEAPQEANVADDSRNNNNNNNNNNQNVDGANPGNGLLDSNDNGLNGDEGVNGVNGQNEFNGLNNGFESNGEFNGVNNGFEFNGFNGGCNGVNNIDENNGFNNFGEFGEVPTGTILSPFQLEVQQQEGNQR